VSANEAERINKAHASLKVSFEDKLKITNWLDTNGPFFGMYRGCKQLIQSRPGFLPTPTFERASNNRSRIPGNQR
jgi:hypothetical protein